MQVQRVGTTSLKTGLRSPFGWNQLVIVSIWGTVKDWTATVRNAPSLEDIKKKLLAFTLPLPWLYHWNIIPRWICKGTHLNKLRVKSPKEGNGRIRIPGWRGWISANPIATWNFLFPKEFLGKALVALSPRDSTSSFNDQLRGQFSHPALWCSQVLEETDASPGCHTPAHPTDGSLTHPEVTFDFSYSSSSNIKQVRLLIFYLPQPWFLYFSEALYPDDCLWECTLFSGDTLLSIWRDVTLSWDQSEKQ